MDFIPAGYITIRDAIDCILRATHGEDWGQQEIELESEEVAVPGTNIGNGEPLSAYPYNRSEIAEASQQMRLAEEKLLTELQSKNLKAEVEEGLQIPRTYWGTPGASTTMQTGLLQLGVGAQPEDLKLHHKRVLLKQEALDDWLTNIDGNKSDVRARRRGADEDAVIRSKIELIHAAAKRLWPEGKDAPGRNQAARLLAEEKTVNETGYSEQTIRKIVDGSYSASVRLKIPGLPGIDTRRNT